MRRLGSAVRSEVAARPKTEPEDAWRNFDAASDRDWLELIRDVAAIANSDGGTIPLRIVSDDSRSHSSSAVGVPTRNDIVQRLGEYSESRFDDVQVRSADATPEASVVITVGRTLFPIVFGKAGCYANPGHSPTQCEVFPAGSLFFRRENQTVPGTTNQLRTFFERLLRRVRRRWLTGIRRVVNSPIDVVGKPHAAGQTGRRAQNEPPNVQPVRITTEPYAPALQPQDVSRLYPWRQKDLLRELNGRLGRLALTTYDIQAVRRQHQLDERPDFVFHLPGAGRRYSPAAADWFIEQHQRDSNFFQKARSADQETLKLRRKKPR